MAWRSGSFSRSFLSTARASIRPTAPAPLPRARPPSVAAAPRIQSRRLSFVTSRNFGELGCIQSLLPLHSVTAATRLTSHLSVNARACCELSQGKNGKDG
ncbi:Protein NUCLEAR FUSION DEFECTIVE 6 chloroplastic/mitochondrial isoform X2 [Quillaja saponaria]|uniref:Protein NUCLEAR FUSION DEFECTIVE 6 chloroplastic/mitochondrial isoform X2 n=1 Tax=Quillaja saponaria TaxID=32244 RepID=A0AAD7P8M2_QUISA|nr:Protein NUCLEAR FUSION DEFECTIVE 6 chloroplastic/mitochondrial isoform X2 [Quillaja saponaria]